MAETATESSSGEDLSVSPASESKKKERNERQTLASMAEDLQRNVISSTDSAIRSARSLHHNSSAHFRNLQEFVANAKSHYKTYEDTFFNTVKGPRRFLFRHTLGRLRSEEAQFVKAEKNVKELSLSVDVMKNESRKLLERAALAEKDMKYGHTELMKAGNQIQHLAKSVYKVEAQAADLVDGLRETPGREALKLRAEVASVLSHLKKQRVELDKRIMQISDLGVPV
ncbi:hypothetical protein L484_002346 [Morus notabilis]|uniref:Uncharacterized protein n=1 Tax=Morus notabilis TaxID=981085 RepID=W9RR71_9ROSA|nr:hypothetical protein L484_002346 [Morus notabilis]